MINKFSHSKYHSSTAVVVSYCLVGMNKIRVYNIVHIRGCAPVPWIYQAGAQQILTQQVAKFLVVVIK
jgi:hypothetical protein